MTLTEFLLARIAEDEAVVRAFVDEGQWQQWALQDFSGPTRDDEYAQLTIGAARVLAECEAKRRIVGYWQDSDNTSGGSPVDADVTLRLLALPYADHPDCRDEWRP